MSTETTTAAGWKKAAIHNILLPSGVRVDIRIPDLPALVEAGTIPQTLLDAAIQAAQPTSTPSATEDDIKQQRELTDLVVQATVVNPKLTEADLKDIPVEDKALIVSIAFRDTDLDAEGAHIAGLDKSEKFRRFRLLGEFEPTLEGL